MFATLLPYVFAVAATLANHTPADFNAAILTHCTPVYLPGDFIGCEDTTASPDEDTSYAGVLWVPTPHSNVGDALIPSLETGP